MGIPTDVEVRTLIDVYGVPEYGDTLCLATMAKTLDLNPKSTRFRTVIAAYRRTLKLYNVVMKLDRGELSPLSDHEKLEMAQRDINRSMQKISESVAMASRIEVNHPNSYRGPFLRQHVLNYERLSHVNATQLHLNL